MCGKWLGKWRITQISKYCFRTSNDILRAEKLK